MADLRPGELQQLEQQLRLRAQQAAPAGPMGPPRTLAQFRADRED